MTVPELQEGSVAGPAAGDETRARQLLFLLGAAIAIAVGPYLPGLIGAVVLQVCTVGAYRRLARRIRPSVAAFVITIAALLLILLPGTWLVTTAFVEASELLRRLGASDLFQRMARARIGGLEMGGQVANAGAAFVSWLGGRAISLFDGATHFTLNLAIALFGLYYLLLGGSRAWYRARRYLPFSPEIAERLRHRFVAVTEAMLLGTFLTAVLQGTLVGAAFAFFDLRAPILWGVVTACVSVLPLFGSSLVWLPGAMALAAAHRYGAAVALVVFGAVFVSNIDNFVRLVVYRRVSNVHPMITLVGAFAGVSVFGVAGVLAGPLVLLYFFELLRAYEDMRRSR